MKSPYIFCWQQFTTENNEYFLCMIQRQAFAVNCLVLHALPGDTFSIYKLLFAFLQILFSFFLYRYWIWRCYNSFVPFIGHKEWQSESFTWGILQTKSSKFDELVGYSICICYSDILPGECLENLKINWQDMFETIYCLHNEHLTLFSQ